MEKAHAAGVEVEAELGILSGVEDDLVIETSASRYTSPDEVIDFVSQTGSAIHSDCPRICKTLHPV